MALVGGAVVTCLLLGQVALFLYVWRIIFPFFRSIADWFHNRVNCLPFFLFMFIILNILGALMAIYIVLLPDHPALIWLILIDLPLLSLALLIFNSALLLVLAAGLIRLNQHLFIRFRTWFLTTMFRLVMWRAKRRQAREEEPPKPKRPRRRLRRRRKKEQPKDTDENSGQPSPEV